VIKSDEIVGFLFMSKPQVNPAVRSPHALPAGFFIDDILAKNTAFSSKSA
jgi:hypothetical protein